MQRLFGPAASDPPKGSRVADLAPEISASVELVAIDASAFEDGATGVGITPGFAVLVEDPVPVVLPVAYECADAVLSVRNGNDRRKIS